MVVNTRRGSETQQPLVFIPGLIVPEALYRIDELWARMGWAKASYRAACRKGLRVRRSGKRAYVLGADAIAFIASQTGPQ